MDIAHGPRLENDKLGRDEILDWNTSFKRNFSKLSENPKVFDIGSTVLKLWLLKDTPLRLINDFVNLLAAITWILCIESQNFYGFLKA